MVRGLVFVMLVLPLLGGSLATAQPPAGGTLRGSARDTQGAALPGVSIVMTSPDAPGVYEAVTDDHGSYRILDLPPGTYRVQASLGGFDTLTQTVVARAGLNVTLDLTMQVAGVTERVEVRNDPPLLESTTASGAVNISGEFQRRVPLSGKRHWADFVKMTPGAMGGDMQATVDQAVSFSIHGAPPTSVSIQIDGIDLAAPTNNWPGYLGLALDTVADVKVTTSGIDPAAPLGMGAAFSLVTQSGTNDLKGTAGLFYQPRRWVGSNQPGGSSTTLQLVQPEASLGGPINRDRWWFFGTYRYLFNSVARSHSGQQLADLEALTPTFEPFADDAEGHIPFVKTTGQLSASHQLTAIYNYDVIRADRNSSLYAAPFARSNIGGHGTALRLTSTWSSRLVTSVAASFNDKSFERRTLVSDRPSRQVHRTVFPSNGRLLGTGVIAYLDTIPQGLASPNTKSTLSAEATYYVADWLGAHEIRFGGQLQTIHSETQNAFVNQGFSLEEVVLRDPGAPHAGWVPFHQQRTDPDLYTASLADTTDHALHVQDAWRPTSRLTVTAGLRTDIVRRVDALVDIETQRSVELGPRFGANYLLTSDARSTLRASWARMHENVLENQAQAGTNRATIRDLYDVDLNGTFETEFVTPGGPEVVSDRIIDGAYHQPFVDEWTVGYRQQLPGQVSLDAGFIHRNYRHRTALVEQNGRYEGGVFHGYQNEDTNEIYLLTNNRWNRPVYSAFELQVAKEGRDLKVLASVTRQWRHIAGTWQPHDPASFIQPEAFPNDRGIGSVRVSTNVATDANGLSGTHMTGLDNQAMADYVARLSVAYQGPWNVILATNYAWQAGAWSGPVVTRVPEPDPQFGPPTVELANGRVVANPLATTIRFAHRTRAEGQLKLADVHYWNIRLGKTFRLAGWRLETAIDVFNALNVGRDEAFESGANQLYSPNFGLTTRRQSPRAAQLSVRLQF